VGWETERTTQAGTRYGCFLPDLTGLARGLSAADLPPHYIRAPCRRGKFRARPQRRARTLRLRTSGPTPLRCSWFVPDPIRMGIMHLTYQVAPW